MIFQELLQVCSVENVIQRMRELSEKARTDDGLREKTVRLIEKIETQTDCVVYDDKLFCFAAVPKGDAENSVYVGLYDIAEKDLDGGWENYYKNGVRDWGFVDFQAPGIEVLEPSLQKYGADTIAAGVLAFILFGD